MDIERIVTGVDASGRSTVVEHATTTGIAPGSLPGLTFHRLWATEEHASVPLTDPTAVAYWPGPDGTRFLVVEWAPASETADSSSAGTDEADDGEALLPGLAGAFEADNPGFHTTASIDYGVCLDGEMWLVLDDQELRIRPGTTVVQRGTRHAWQNRSDRPATMLYVLVGANPAVI